MASSSRPVSRHGRKFRQYKPLTPPSDEELPSFSTLDYENTEDLFVPRDNPIIERPKTSRGYRSRGERPPPEQDVVHDPRPVSDVHSYEGHQRPMSRRGRPQRSRPETYGHSNYENRREHHNYNDNRREGHQVNRSKRYRGNDEILYQADSYENQMVDYPGSRQSSHHDSRPQYSRENSFMTSPPNSAHRPSSPKNSRQSRRPANSSKSTSSKKKKTTHEAHRPQETVAMRPPSSLGKYAPLPAIGRTSDYHAAESNKQDTLADRISRMAMQDDFAEYHYTENHESEDESQPYHVDEADSVSDGPIHSGRRYSIETNDSGQRYNNEERNNNRRLSTETNDSGHGYVYTEGNTKRRYSVEMPDTGQWDEDNSRYTDEDIGGYEHYSEADNEKKLRHSGSDVRSSDEVLKSDAKSSGLSNPAQEPNVLILGGSEEYFSESSQECLEPVSNHLAATQQSDVQQMAGKRLTSNVPNSETQESAAFQRHELPSEPTDRERRTLLAIRLPDGKRYERHFKLSEPLVNVLYFAENMSSTPFPNHVLACNAPRHVFSNMDKLIGQLDLPDKTLLYVEKINK